MIYIPNEDVFTSNNGICALSESEINSVNGGRTFEELYEIAVVFYDRLTIQALLPVLYLYVMLIGGWSPPKDPPKDPPKE